MLGGILTALIEKSAINSKLDVDHCLLELDEAYLLKAVDKFNPDLLLVTNLFRNSLIVMVNWTQQQGKFRLQLTKLP